MKKIVFIFAAAIMLSLADFVTAQAGWEIKDNSMRFKKADGTYICDDLMIYNQMWFFFDKEGNAIYIDSFDRPDDWIDRTNEHEKKIQHIRDVFTQTNSRSDYVILQSDHYTDFGENDGTLVKAVLKNDYYLILPLVECYYENNQLIFVYATDGVNEYRYYFKDSNLIREIGPDGSIIDYLDGEGLKKTADLNIEQILGRANWEVGLFAEDFFGTGF